MNRASFEAALDMGRLQTRVLGSDGPKWYDCRRGGRTRTWKRDSSRFQIPIKFRFRDHITVTESHFNNGQVDEWFRVRSGGA